MIMMKRIFTFFVCIAMVMTAGLSFVRPSSAAGALTLSHGVIADGKFTVSLAFPDNLTWGGFTFNVSYDKNAVQLTADPDMTSKPMIYAAPSSTGNSTGSLTIAGGGVSDITAAGVVITMPFQVVDPNATSVTISVSVQKFVTFNNTPVDCAAPAPLTVNLQQAPVNPEPPVSSEPEPPVSSEPAPPVSSTPPATSTKKPNSNTQSNVTDSENITDTETNFPISDSSTHTVSDETDVTDVTDTDDATEMTSQWTASSTEHTDETPKKICFTPLTLGLISGGIALLFCGGLTAIALLRHKKQD